MASYNQMVSDRYWSLRARYAHRRNQKTARTQHYGPNQVGLLYTEESTSSARRAAILRFSQYLQKEGKVVTTLGYYPHTDPIAEPDHRFPSFSRADLSWWRNAMSPPITHFQATNFSYLYYIGYTTDPWLDFVIASCHAKYKVAPFIPGKIYLFDVNVKTVVKPTEDIDFDGLCTTLANQIQSLQLP